MGDEEDAQAIRTMANAIHTSNRDDPVAQSGTTRDDHLVGMEIAEHHARAALRGLKKEGFTIIRERRKQPR